MLSTLMLALQSQYWTVCECVWFLKLLGILDLPFPCYLSCCPSPPVSLLGHSPAHFLSITVARVMILSSLWLWFCLTGLSLVCFPCSTLLFCFLIPSPITSPPPSHEGTEGARIYKSRWPINSEPIRKAMPVQIVLSEGGMPVKNNLFSTGRVQENQRQVCHLIEY